jgi:hypothetical protein
MSVEAMALVLHHSRAKGTAKLVLLGIANHQGDGGAWPHVATLARYANVTERAVQDAIAKLVKAGELAVHAQAGGPRYMPDHERPNRYDVLVSCPITCDRTTNLRNRSYPQPTLDLSDSSGSDPVKLASPGEADFTPGGEEDFTHNRPTQPPVDTSVVHLTRPRARVEMNEFQRAAIAEARRAMRDKAQRAGGEGG